MRRREVIAFLAGAIVNLKTAKAMRLNISDSFLLLAHEVIE
jgi:hypothetical protein